MIRRVVVAILALVLWAAPAVANPAYVQFWSTQTAASSSEASRTLTYNNGGSGAANPSAGNLLVCAVSAAGNAANQYPLSDPSGWSFAGHDATSQWNIISIWYKTAVGGGSDTCAVSFSGVDNVAMTVWGVEVSGAAFDIVTTGAASSVTTPWNTPTGTGTAAGTNELQIIFGAMDDAIVNPSAASGFTNRAPAANGNHGDGGASFGGSWNMWTANALTGSTSIASVNISWSGGSGTETVVGMSIVLKSAAVGPTFGLYPKAGAYPGGAP